MNSKQRAIASGWQRAPFGWLHSTTTPHLREAFVAKPDNTSREWTHAPKSVNSVFTSTKPGNERVFGIRRRAYQQRHGRYSFDVTIVSLVQLFAKHIRV